MKLQSRYMRIMLLVFGLTLPLKGGQAQDRPTEPLDSSQRAAEKVARAYVDAVIGGNAELLLALSEVPFAWDRRRVVTTASELRALYADVGESPRRLASIGEGRIVNEVLQIERDCIPLAAYVVRVPVGEEEATVCVTRGDQQRVIGFSD